MQFDFHIFSLRDTFLEVALVLSSLPRNESQEHFCHDQSFV